MVHFVEHPLLDKVKACSPDPIKAADFFLWLLHPLDVARLSNVVYHPYLKPTYFRMLEEFPLPESHREGFIEVPIGKSSDQQSGGFLLKTCVGAAILFCL